MRHGVFRSLGSDDSDCIAYANQATAQLESITLQMAREWRPLENFTADELERIYLETIKLLRDAQQAVSGSPAFDLEVDLPRVRSAFREINAKIADGTRAYVPAIAQARLEKAQRAVVHAPDVKTWVMRSMTVALNAFVLRGVMDCEFEKKVSFFMSITGQFQMFYSVVKEIVGVVVTAVDKVIKAGSAVFDLVDTLIKVGVAGGAAYFVWAMFLRDRKSSSRRRR